MSTCHFRLNVSPEAHLDEMTVIIDGTGTDLEDLEIDGMRPVMAVARQSAVNGECRNYF